LWRSRFKPVKQPNTLNPAGLHRWVMERRPWLSVAPTSATSSLVRAIIKAPGGCRGLIVLNNARGQRLGLDLVRTAFTEPYLDGPAATDQRFNFFEYQFNAAPWEDEP
jgi:hypothetical protein